jgi:hypothetical protein
MRSATIGAASRGCYGLIGAAFVTGTAGQSLRAPASGLWFRCWASRKSDPTRAEWPKFMRCFVGRLYRCGATGAVQDSQTHGIPTSAAQPAARRSDRIRVQFRHCDDPWRGATSVECPQPLGRRHRERVSCPEQRRQPELHRNRKKPGLQWGDPPWLDLRFRRPARRGPSEPGFNLSLELGHGRHSHRGHRVLDRPYGHRWQRHRRDRRLRVRSYVFHRGDRYT